MTSTIATIYLTEVKSIFGHGYRIASGPDDYRDEPGDHWETCEKWKLPDGWKLVDLVDGTQVIKTPRGDHVSDIRGEIIPHRSGRPRLITTNEGWPVLKPAA